jgi:hypothetical protein
MNLIMENYSLQKARWPSEGRHILAQYDADSVIVYQAYRPEIGLFAAEHGHFGRGFSLNRMSWIKPNFLWMMYRCGWATKEGQETVLAVRLKRTAFDEILIRAVHSTFVPEVYGSPDAWRETLNKSEVRLQWDPDHDPNGAALPRRAIQLGHNGETLAAYARSWIIDIEDITAFVRDQYRHVLNGDQSALMTPREEVYRPDDPTIVAKVGLDSKIGEIP